MDNQMVGYYRIKLVEIVIRASILYGSVARYTYRYGKSKRVAEDVVNLTVGAHVIR